MDNLSFSFLPIDKDIKAAVPSPSKRPNAKPKQVNGKTIEVAVFPRVPTLLFPMKIWSTILYKALINKDKTHGIENFNNNLDILPSTKYEFCCIINNFLLFTTNVATKAETISLLATKLY